MRIFFDNWKLTLLIAILCIGSYAAIDSFIDIAAVMSADGYEALDLQAAEFALSMRSQALTDFFHIVTAFGNWQVFLTLFIGLSVVFFKSNKHIRTPLIVGGLISGAGVVMYILKDIFDRQRPSVDVLVDARLSSFPSGHSMLSVVFYGFLIFMVWKLIDHHGLRLTLSIVLVLLILTICWSRVYLGAHYLSDVLAGMVAGAGWLCMALLAYLVVKLYKEGRLSEVNEG